MTEINIHRVARYMAAHAVKIGVIRRDEMEDFVSYGWIKLAEHPTAATKDVNYCCGVLRNAFMNYIKRKLNHDREVVYQDAKHTTLPPNLDVLRALREPDVFEWLTNDGPPPVEADADEVALMNVDTRVCWYCHERKPATAEYFPWRTRDKVKHLALTRCRKCKSKQSAELRRKRRQAK